MPLCLLRVNGGKQAPTLYQYSFHCVKRYYDFFYKRSNNDAFLRRVAMRYALIYLALIWGFLKEKFFTQFIDKYY
jgi:hypothetical protein